MSFLVALFAFLIAILILVTVHEFGHFWVAKKLGVKVLRFSVGFGKVLYKKAIGGTEFVLSAIPLGGYVKMLDIREGEVLREEMAYEFASQPLYKRTFIAVAGPAFNFIFAILAYWMIFMNGVTGLHPVVGEIKPGSLAEVAGFQAGDKVIMVDAEKITLWSDVIEAILNSSIDKTQVPVMVQDLDGVERELNINTEGLLKSPEIWLKNLSLKPYLPPIIELVDKEGSAAKAGLQTNDRILAMDDKPVGSWHSFVANIERKSGQRVNLTISRSNENVSVTLIPKPIKENGKIVGKIGVKLRQDKKYVSIVSYGFVESIVKAVGKAWDTGKLIVIMIGKMATGDVSLKENVGGPISIAKFAGSMFSAGLTYFVEFLAIISISLGILNLLPIPVLDGGHLLLYLIETIKGSPLSEQTEEVLQKVGLMMILALMILALFNDINRLL